MYKKICICFSTALLLGTIPALGADIDVTIDGVTLQSDVPAQLIDGATMVPLRDICDALGAEVQWDGTNSTITIQKDTTTNVLQIGNRYATVTQNGETQKVTIPTAPTIKNGRTLVPLRFVSENLDTEVIWQNDTKTVEIRTQQEIAAPIQQMNTYNITSGAVNVSIGDDVEVLWEQLGSPSRTEKGIAGLTWYVYNRDYERFFMFAVEQNKVCGFYTNIADFVVNGTIESGKPYTGSYENMTIYRDSLDGNKVYAVLCYPNTYIAQDWAEYATSEEYLEIQAKQNFDCVNAFRVANGLKPLKWDDLVSKTALSHAQDMAQNNYFDHISQTGQKPHERYYAMGGTSFSLYGENISAGHQTGVSAFAGWLNSQGHRENMLQESFTEIGIAGAYEQNSPYRYYFVQNFKG